MANRYAKLLLAKNEAVKGTDIVPVPANDAVRVLSAEIAITADSIERPVVKPTMGQLAHLIGKKTVQLTIECELRGSGAAGTAPDFGPLLRACGIDETIAASTSVTYDPLTGSHEAVSIYWYEDGVFWKLIGAVGTFTIGYEMNTATKITFTMSAPYLEPTTVAYPGGETYQTTPPVVASSADIFSEGGAIKVGSFEVDVANDVQEHYTTGNHEFTVADRQPTLKLTKDSISTIVDWTALMAETDVALSATIDGGAGNITVITGDVARRTAITGGLRAEVHTRDIELYLYETSGDDQFQIVFT